MRFDIIKRNQISLYIVTFVIIGLLISNATSAIIQTTAQNSRNEEELNLSNQGLKELPQIQMHKKFIESERQSISSHQSNVKLRKADISTEFLSGSDHPSPMDVVFDVFHPTMADAGDDNVIMGYEFDYHNTTDPSEDYKTVIWQGSNNNGGNWSNGIYWVNDTTGDPLNISYPDADYWGKNNSKNVFYGTVVAEPGIHSSEMILMKIEGDPTEQNSYNTISWDWTAAGHLNMTSARIACDDSQNTWEFGTISMVMDYQAYANAPCSSYANEDDPQSGWISCYPIGGCRTTGCAIDGEDAAGGYPVYIGWDLVYGGNDSVLIGFDFFEDWSGTGGYVWWWGPDIMLRKPCLDASDGHFIMLSEFWIYDDINMTYDKDIVAWHYNYSNPNHVADVDIVLDWVGGTIWDETTPALRNTQGMSYIATFVLNNTLYACKTNDGGVTWTTPMPQSEMDYVLEDDFKNPDIAEIRPLDMTWKVIWAYDTGLKDPSGTKRINWNRIYYWSPWGCGDFNVPENDPTGGDGVVNIADLTFLIAYLYGGGPNPNPYCLADLNNDDIINIADLTYLIAYLYGGGPNPNPDCCNPVWR